MQIIFATRKDCLSNPGGDTIQLLKTKEYMERLFGVKIFVINDPKKLDSILKTKKVEICHIFHIQTSEEVLAFMEICKINNVPVAFSPIFWDLSFAVYVKALTKIGFFKTRKIFLKFKPLFDFLAKKIFQILPSNLPLKRSYYNKLTFSKYKRAVLLADLLLPNSYEELEKLARFCNIDPISLQKKSSIVPNGADEEFLYKEIVESPERKIILQIGRIEPGKNQLGTLLALNELPDIPLLFIGKVFDKNYFKVIKKIATKRGNVKFIEEISHSKLKGFYKKAKIHILPSFRESPGLVSLEAFLAGCEIVVSDSRFCPIKYYNFEKVAHICNPFDVSSIKKAIKGALEFKKNNHKRRKEFYKNIEWKQVAKTTFKAYQKLI